MSFQQFTVIANATLMISLDVVFFVNFRKDKSTRTIWKISLVIVLVIVNILWAITTAERWRIASL